MRRVATFSACAGGLGYAASKVHFALKGQLGLPGFPAAASSYRATDDVVLAQIGNAGVGLISAVLAVSLLWPIQDRRVRLAVHIISWIALLVLAAGLIGFTVRALGLADGLGPPAQSPAAQLVLLAGALWILSWAVALRLHWAAATRAEVRPGPAPSSS